LEFGISEINAGECNWAISEAYSNTDTVVAGRVLLSKQCFAFDCYQIDYVAHRAAKRSKENQPPDEEASTSSKDFARKQSIEVRFEDIERIDSADETIILTLARAPTCFLRCSGFRRAVCVTNDITGGALSICFHLGAAGQGQVSFAEAVELALMHAPRLEELFREAGRGTERLPSTPIRIKRQIQDPESSFKRRRITVSCDDFCDPGAVVDCLTFHVS